MSTTRIRTNRLLTVSTAVVLGAASLGCGLIDSVKNVTDNVNALSEFSDRLGKAENLTYTAEYRMSGEQGGTATLIRQPPNSAVINGDKRMISTSEYYISCDGDQCRQTPNTGGAEAANAGLIANAATVGFVTSEYALSLVAAAAFVPTVKVKTSERKIAGQKSLCADVTGLADAAGNTGISGDFSVCVTDDGVLSAFTGMVVDKEQVNIELTSFSTKVDPKAFTPPAGAAILDAAGEAVN